MYYYVSPLVHGFFKIKVIYSIKVTDLISSASNTNETFKVYQVFIIKVHGTTICLYSRGGYNEPVWVTQIKSSISWGEKKSLIGLIGKLLRVRCG